MKEKKLTERQRGYLKLATEVQEIAKPYLRRGGYSLNKIYYNYVVKRIPICINTFRKMMKEDVSQFQELVDEYHKKVKGKYMDSLSDRSKQRMKADDPSENEMTN